MHVHFISPIWCKNHGTVKTWEERTGDKLELSNDFLAETKSISLNSSDYYYSRSCYKSRTFFEICHALFLKTIHPIYLVFNIQPNILHKMELKILFWPQVFFSFSALFSKFCTFHRMVNQLFVFEFFRFIYGLNEWTNYYN